MSQIITRCICKNYTKINTLKVDTSAYFKGLPDANSIDMELEA